jgi:hypothetical protein
VAVEPRGDVRHPQLESGGRQVGHDLVGERARLGDFVSDEELTRLQKEAETELAEPGRWGTTFMVIQSWGRRVT